MAIETLFPVKAPPPAPKQSPSLDLQVLNKPSSKPDFAAGDPAIQSKLPPVPAIVKVPRFMGDPNNGRMIEGPLFTGTDHATAYTYVGNDTPVTTTAADGSSSTAQGNSVGITPTTDASTAASAIIRREENDGYSQKDAQWDVNAFRGGYGSDTYTQADGTVVKLSYKGQPVAQADAERDLQRRLPLLNATASRSIGPAYDKLPGYVQGALMTVVDNYGHIPAHVAAAAKTGDLQQLANAVASLGSDNGGIRAARYNRVANIIRGTGLQNAGT